MSEHLFLLGNWHKGVRSAFHEEQREYIYYDMYAPVLTNRLRRETNVLNTLDLLCECLLVGKKNLV